MQTISSQRYRDEAIVEAKRSAQDYKVFVSPAFDIGGDTFRVVLDGHHSLEAAMLDGAEPEFIEQDARDNDTINVLTQGSTEDFLEMHRIDCDFYDISTGRDVW